ncbi:MAG: HAD family hydrolase [Endomicrobiaceae bacterium]
MSIEVIVFDLGKVVFDFDISKLSSGFSKSSTKPYQDINSILLNHWEIVAEYEKGRISSKAFYENVMKALDMKISYLNFCDIWNDIFTPFGDVTAFLPLLSSRYKLSLLSNTNDLHFEFLKNKYPHIFKYFTNYHLSYRMNTRKPEEEIYKKTIAFYNIEPEKIFFTDDLSVNVDKAREMKISAFKFDGLSKLKRDLSFAGVKY